MLKVFKASAGSGKTFRLVLEYIVLLLRHPANYRRILAVTFTNKATAEMKERVVKELFQLSEGANSKYLDLIQIETGLTPIQIAAKAGVALQLILYDYNRFSISTIDKFSQRVIKAFNRESGIVPNYQVELDTELLLQEAADRLIGSLGNNTPLLRWLEEFVEEKISDGRNFSIEDDIINLGGELFKEELQKATGELQAFFADAERGKSYLAQLHRMIQKFESEVSAKARIVVDTYHNEGFTIDDFAFSKGGIAGILEKSLSEIVTKLGSRVFECLASAEKWVVKKHPKRDQIIELADTTLIPLLKDFIDVYEAGATDYFTAKAIKRQWYMMMVLMDLYREIGTLSRERNILPMASSNMLLQAIIDDNETPFIYEKIGNIYHHFMLDEFQDTSGMQWQNFKPLLENGLAQGKFSLVVGDVKQSIYRWRNSDWNILGSKIFTDFAHQEIGVNHLDINYRSDATIVQFNNDFFTTIREFLLHEDLQTSESDYAQQLEQLYSDTIQQCSSKSKAGYVRIEKIETSNSDFDEMTLIRLLEQVCELQDKGYAPSDIAILVRKKDQGALVLEYFLKASSLPEYQRYNLRIVSGESLFIKASPAVNFIAGVLHYLTRPNDLINRATLLHLYMNLTNRDRSDEPTGNWFLPPDFTPLFDDHLLEKLNFIESRISFSSLEEIVTSISSAFSLFEIPSELPYLQTFIDKISEVRKSSLLDLSNFSEWWEERGSKISVQASESSDSIRLLTIHKSKGLQFKAVLIPFFSWSWRNNNNEILWINPHSAPFNQVPLVPVALTSALLRTHYTKSYQNELFNLLVDNLNMVYVAFTRAESVLMVNYPGEFQKSSFTLFLDSTLQKLVEPKFKESGGINSSVFEWGELEKQEGNPADILARTPVTWVHHDFSGRLRLRSDFSGLDESTTDGLTGVEMGKIVHTILSQIETKDDVAPALLRAQKARLLNGTVMQTITEMVNRMINKTEAESWFDGTWKVLNERILLTSDAVYRPDRVMIKNNIAVVVDYKTGANVSSGHIQQLQTYCRLIETSGISEVSGYLWYIQLDQITKAYPDNQIT